MTIIEALVRLRDDLKTWFSNNLRLKLNRNLGASHEGKILIVNENGDIKPKDAMFIDTKITAAINSLSLSDIGLTFGTEDLIDGSSELTSGHFYFVIED